MLPAASLFLLFSLTNVGAWESCYSAPGDPLFPSSQQLSQFNESIDGRLISVIPSAKFCENRVGGCTADEWASDIFRGSIPGAMGNINWEQDYTSKPPSLCFPETPVCGQGDVPLYAVNATKAEHIQAGIRFAQGHNLKVVAKASGHDYLGRSTAKNSFLLWTRYIQGMRFYDNFTVGGVSMGSAVTVGSGVPIRALYQAAKSHGKIVVSGTAPNVAPAGGYVQGGGHSSMSPLLGLAIDNTLEFEVVLANGDLVTANAISNPDLFWAMRGGGPGSWGVIISATFQTFPNFNVVTHEVSIALNSTAEAAEMAYIHASHIFDLDPLHVGQYYFVLPNPPGYVWYQVTYFPDTTIPIATAAIAPFLVAASRSGFSVQSTNVNSSVINDQLSLTNFWDIAGNNLIIGARLVPADVFRTNPAAVREAYLKVLNAGTPLVAGLMVAGGRVSQNANISAAINPLWRTAKSNVIIISEWNDTTPPDAVASIRADLTHNKVPILAALAGGEGSAAYVNEADVMEPEWQTTLYGPNYARLSEVKKQYDPEDIFIVPVGVGSERWDAAGFCRIG